KVAQTIIFDHAASIRTVYRARRDAMLTALNEFMPDGVSWTEPEGGMFVWMTLPQGLDAAELLAQSIAEIRVAFVPGAAFYPDRSGKNTIRLSFSVPPPERVREGIQRLGGLITQAVAALKVNA
ncbi:MAG: aminotransferase class I/II-fold pyridoxal phosphate-dependent enzyme, partial [Elstera sp.]